MIDALAGVMRGAQETPDGDTDNPFTGLDAGMIVPAKLAPMGDFHFFFVAGPAMPSARFGAVMTFFEEQRITPSPEQFRDQPHMLGGLWDVIDQERKKEIDLRNADGHALVFHAAIFACPDRPALERFLDRL